MIFEDVAAIKALLRGLTDKKREVVLSALSWIRKSEDRRLVKALITALARREATKGHIYYEILATLRAITEKDYDSVSAWKTYLDRINAGKEPFAPHTRVRKQKTKTQRTRLPHDP